MKWLSPKALLLALLNLLLAGYLYHQWDAPSGLEPVAETQARVQPGPSSSSALAGARGEVLPGAFSEINQRPLFHQDRKPVPVEAVKTPQGLVQRISSSYELEGVAMAGERQVAMLRNIRSKELKSVSPGDELDGWKVSELESRKVLFERDGRSDELLLRAELESGAANVPARGPARAPGRAPARPQNFRNRR